MAIDLAEGQAVEGPVVVGPAGAHGRGVVALVALVEEA